MARNKIDVDEELEEKFDLGQVKRLGKYVGPYKNKMIWTIILMLISSALTMLQPLFLKDVMEAIENFQKGLISDSDAIKIILTNSVLMLIDTLVVVLILRVKIRWTNQVGQNVVHDLRKDLFVHLQKLPFSYYDERPHGKIQVRVVNYVNKIGRAHV